MQLDQVLSIIPSAIFWKDIHGVFRGCNQQFLAFAGMQNEEQLIGKTDK